jgi:WD40 repeat protein
MTVKHVTPEHISWAITDSDLSHDGRFLVHSSLHPYVSIYDIEAGAYKQRFNLASNAEEDESPNWYSTLRLFSVKFNQDASQLLASSAGHGHNRAMLKVFDINL